MAPQHKIQLVTRVMALALVVTSPSLADYNIVQAPYSSPVVYKQVPRYDFEYGVADDSYGGPNFGASETRDGYVTKGSYYVDLPDGRRQKVSYYVTEDSGFVAEVSYEQRYEKPKYVLKKVQPSYRKISYIQPKAQVYKKAVSVVPAVQQFSYQEIPAPRPKFSKPMSVTSDESDEDSDEQEAKELDNQTHPGKKSPRRVGAGSSHKGVADLGFRGRSTSYFTSYSSKPGRSGSYSYVSVPGTVISSPHRKLPREIQQYNLDALSYL